MGARAVRIAGSKHDRKCVTWARIGRGFVEGTRDEENLLELLTGCPPHVVCFHLQLGFACRRAKVSEI